jgi:hypothetical protein
LSNWWRESQRINVHAARDERRASRRILVSGAAREALARGALRLIDRGLHALKGLPGEWQLFAVAQTLTNGRFRRRLSWCRAS